MWEIVVGGLMTSLGFVIGEYFGFMKWRKQNRISYWKEKKDKLDSILTPNFFHSILEGSFSSEVVSDITKSEGSDKLLDIFYEHLEKTEDNKFSSEERNLLVGELREYVQTEKAKYDGEIEKIQNRWF